MGIVEAQRVARRHAFLLDARVQRVALAFLNEPMHHCAFQRLARLVGVI